ncbi:MAG: hypothetical protein A3H34_04830 [Betaproteobacteria bacterium RIFCSPLOWO2_02_FULL_67_19]|nr:MAG: hypothetical protein A3H34_04830 [Betaproteobacteria bacterium RIFCSPLOWO2_02_FULL_67_19]
MKPNKRSALKDAPLRLPGQSIEEYRQERIDKILEPALIATVFIILAALEWVRYLKPTAPSPYFYSSVALIAAAYAGFRIRRAMPGIRALRQARDGERAVGQYLERLRADGYQVFHDIVGSGFNLDHVAIGPAGIFAIETKTFSKPASGPAKVLVDGERILVNGLEPDRDPLVQAKSQAHWLRDLLAESTGRKFQIRSVILFPGWYVEQDRASRREVWVLNPKGLPSFLENENTILGEEDVKLASYHLSRFIRAGEQSG